MCTPPRRRVQSLFTQQLVSSLVLDQEANNTAVLRYDITMHNLNCKYLTVQINDAFGTQHQEATSLWTRYAAERELYSICVF